jgi:hypothetical protein
MRPDTRFAQAGFTLSGPIVHKKLFFSTAYQYTQDDQGKVDRLVLPTQAFRQGDFSAADTIIYDPATGNSDGSGRQPFSGNRIPSGRISLIAQSILNLLPLPQQMDAALGQANYETTHVRSSRTQAFDAAVNWYLSYKDRLSASLSFARPNANAPALLAEYGGPADAGMSGSASQLAMSPGLLYTRQLAASLIMDLHAGWSRYNSHASIPAFSSELANRLGIPGIAASGIAAGTPVIDIAGYSAPLIGFAGNLLGNRRTSVFQAEAKFTTFISNHLLVTGSEIKRRRESLFGGQGDAGPRGTFLFSPLQTAAANDVSSQGGLANALASFLIDTPDSIERSVPARTTGTRRSELALFAKDDWRPVSSLSLTIGLRYEYHGSPVGIEAPGGMSNYDPISNILSVAGYGAIPANLGIRSFRDWLLPRVSASWRLTRHIYVRAGYGIQALPPVIGYYGANYPLVQNDQIAKPGAFLSAGSMASGIPSAIETTIPASGMLAANSNELLTQRYFVAPADMIEGRLHSWHAKVQSNLPWWSVTFDVAYVGSRGHDKPVLRDLNAGVLPGMGDDGRPQFGTFGRRASTFTWWPGRTAYDALQLSLNKWSDRFWIETAYTLGRSRDYASENGKLSTPADPERSWGRADFDRRHAFSTAIEIKPINPASLPQRLRGLLKDWKLIGSFIAQSGTPVDITASNALLNAPGNSQRPNMSYRPTVLGGIGPGQSYFDTSVFSMPAAAAWSNVRRNAVVDGPGVLRLDMSLARNFALSGEIGIELRAECFNVTNTPQFVNPSGEFGAPTFGQVTATVPGSERSMRFSARVHF